MFRKFKKEFRYRRDLMKLDKINHKFYKVLGVFNDIQLENIIDEDLYLNTWDEALLIDGEYLDVKMGLDIYGDTDNVDIVKCRMDTLRKMMEFFNNYFEKKRSELA